MTPEELLAQARMLASGGAERLGSTASRSAALLGRSALEEMLWRQWPEFRDVSGRAMMLTVPFVLQHPVARRIPSVWGRLSAASHHHAYEMPPTTTELNRMLDTVHDVIVTIRDRQQAQDSRS